MLNKIVSRLCMHHKNLLIPLFLASIGTSYAQTFPALSPEQQKQLLEMQIQKLEQLRQLQQMPQLPIGAIPGGAPVQQQRGLQPQLTEQALQAQLNAFPKLADGASFERFRDGFSANGQRYIDPEGKIISYSYDTVTGDVGYVAQVDNVNFVVKVNRVLTNAEPVTIATATRSGGTWQVLSSTGKKLAGDRLIPLAKGFLVARESTGFKYIAGQGITNFAVPDTFTIATFQNGDISGTDYVLVERRPKINKDSTDEFVGTLSALGSVLGLSKKEDYRLYNISSGKFIPLNIASEGKEVQVNSYCRQINYIRAECARVDFYESLFDTVGMPNYSHYFWRISWYKTPTRPVLVAQEGGLTEITATDMTSGKKVSLFHRTMGIAGFSVAQKSSGKVTVSAQLGFDRQTIDDVENALDTGVSMQASNQTQ